MKDVLIVLLCFLVSCQWIDTISMSEEARPESDSDSVVSTTVQDSIPVEQIINDDMPIDYGVSVDDYK